MNLDIKTDIEPAKYILLSYSVLSFSIDESVVSNGLSESSLSINVSVEGGTLKDTSESVYRMKLIINVYEPGTKTSLCQLIIQGVFKDLAGANNDPDKGQIEICQSGLEELYSIAKSTVAMLTSGNGSGGIQLPSVRSIYRNEY